MKKAAPFSSRFNVMAECGMVLLVPFRGAAPDKIDPIPHGPLVGRRQPLNTFI